MWDESVFQNYKKIKEEIQLGGGIDRIKKQHEKGKLTARERIDLLLDEKSFHEVDDMILSRTTDFDMEKKRKYGDGVVVGYGKIHGRTVYIASQDFTVSGGAGGERYALKICHILEMAISTRNPIIYLNDSGGARIEEGICSLSAYSRLFYLNTIASGVIPQIALILGPCAGGASYSPALCDFIFMLENKSEMYLTGPKVVEVTLGEKVSSNDLGGSKVHTEISGVAHFLCKDEEDCFEEVKRLLSYLPQNNEARPPFDNNFKYKQNPKLLQDIVPQRSRVIFDVKLVIENILDDSSFFEVHKFFAPNMVVGFGRIEGRVVGIVANQSTHLGGSVDCNAADKAARFVRFCDCFNIPVLSFVDIPAFYPGSAQEKAGIIRHGAKLLYAFAEATVPKICLIMRKAYGGAFCAMNSKDLGADRVFAWPIAEIAVMGSEAAVNIIYRKEIANSSSPEETRKKYIEEYEDNFLNPYFAASQGFVDEVILPEESRERMSTALDVLESKIGGLPRKKHGNIPL